MTDVHITQAGAYVEYTPDKTAYITQAGAYAEYEGTIARITQAGAYVEYEGTIARITQAGAYVEYEGHVVYVTQAGAYVEYTPVATGALDASIVPFLRVQAGRQTSGLGTAGAMDFCLPAIGNYDDGQLEHVAEWDQGFWTSTIIVERIARYAEFTLDGVLYFETLPIFLEAGFDAFTVSGAGPYIYDGEAGPAAVGTPTPYTFRFGGNDSTSPNSLVQIQDGYCRSMTLSFDLTTKVVMISSQWFGSFIDDNDGSGYEPMSHPWPDNLAMVRGLRTTLERGAAGTTGGDFTGLTAFDCSLIAWQLEIDTGLRPAYAGDENQLDFCAVRHEEPSLEFRPTIRTNATNYAITKVRANLRAFDEILLSFFGDNSRQALLKMTGRFDPQFTAHERANEEVVMQPTFRAETPYTQTTTPHWFSYEIDTQWNRP